ncbi:hypothetical protein MTO96_018346 [Rhipicephalus appendiculatus]
MRPTPRLSRWAHLLVLQRGRARGAGARPAVTFAVAPCSSGRADRAGARCAFSTHGQQRVQRQPGSGRYHAGGMGVRRANDAGEPASTKRLPMANKGTQQAPTKLTTAPAAPLLKTMPPGNVDRLYSGLTALSALTSPTGEPCFAGRRRAR